MSQIVHMPILSDRPDVEVIQSEGRNFISRTDRRFDIILLGRWAGPATLVLIGGFLLRVVVIFSSEMI